jgi:hypothetical protein
MSTYNPIFLVVRCNVNNPEWGPHPKMMSVEKIRSTFSRDDFEGRWADWSLMEINNGYYLAEWGFTPMKRRKRALDHIWPPEEREIATTTDVAFLLRSERESPRLQSWDESEVAPPSCRSFPTPCRNSLLTSV